ncbi:sulfotransferase domain-containing protein [Thalassolituus sp. UBA2590]|jgi:hypothetical protein|uniref:sulfotransferase domain-containing protein n=1 Tax=Thalassolituus sp. UBA2590 TaxID=1947663 RepID=UPI00264A1C66|nr:sulfotransferase domain-containing protein [Thalassolituus sp. UBA2590]|tara:strand:+ start:4337 stop:5215 length:879 start_codon:yes stop_codon:yes gene_type:complete
MDVFLIGAPKTGTTAIAHYLEEHIMVDFCSVKEPNFFSSDLVGGDRAAADLCEYHRLYENDGRIRVEASTTYLYSDYAITKILEINPNAKFIVGIRNYVDLAQSQYKQMLKVGFEDKYRFQSAWDLSTKRKKGLCIPSSCTIPVDIQYDEIISLGKYVETVVDRVGSEKVFIYKYEDLNADFNKVFGDILEFIGLPVQEIEVVERKNPTLVPHSLLLSRFIQMLTIARKRFGLISGFGFGELLRNWNSGKSDVYDLTDYEKMLVVNFSKSDYEVLSSVVKMFGVSIDDYRKI